MFYRWVNILIFFKKNNHKFIDKFSDEFKNRVQSIKTEQFSILIIARQKNSITNLITNLGLRINYDIYKNIKSFASEK